MDSLLKRIETERRNAERLTALLNSLAPALVFGAAAWRVLSETDALIVFLSALVVFFALFLEKVQTTMETIISDLNRRPQCEHSAQLLLSAPEELPFLARLQRRKVAERLEQQDLKSLFPNEWRKRLVPLGVAVMGAMMVVAIPKTPAEQRSSSEPPVEASPTQLRIEHIEVQIQPPAYTSKPNRVQASLNILAEENATVRWTLKLSRACAHVGVATASGDTLRFTQESEAHDAQNIYRAEMKAVQSQVYSLLMDGWTSEVATMDVQKDLPPVVSVLSPASRTEFSSPDSARLVIKVAVSDDYKTRKVNLVLTSAKGKGEAVKFKSDTLRLRPTATLENAIEHYQITLDLKNDGLTYGDECYFFVEAFDNREPKPNVARSETYFVKILDTLQVASSESIAMPVLRLPTYLRSQRQIIIDTEKLIAEKDALEPASFRTKSENLGVDQKVLRLRYGKFLGEELAISIGETENERLAKTMRDSSTNPIVKLQKQAVARVPKADDGHNHDREAQFAEPYMHRHDLEESATFFSEPIKQKLKAALAQMWESEKFLRLAEPERALPYEYKALQLLKELQQDARVYVEKSGFDPAPIDEARLRLTGENAKIKSVRIAERREMNDDFEVIKNALDMLNAEKKTFSNLELATLEEAGKRFAQVALEKNLKELSALKSLRKLITDSKSGRASSEDDIQRVKRAFAYMLPLPHQLPKSQSVGRSNLAKRYFQSLNENR